MARNKQVAKTVGVISGFTMISRIFGYIRDGLGGAILGAGLANDAYLAAFRIPNLLRDLFAEGALSSAFIPTFTKTAVQEGNARAWQLASVVINAVVLIMLAVVLLGELGAPYIVRVIVPGFAAIPEKLALTTHLTRILLPFISFISLAAVLMGILNSRERFGFPAFAPVMLNLTMIAVGLFLCPLFGEEPEKQVVGWAWGALAGGFMQMAIQIPAVMRQGFRWKPIINWKDPGLRRIVTLMLPAIVGLSVTQINLFINTLIASFLPEGSVTYLYYGNRIMQLPLGVFGVAIATALLPVTSKHLAVGEHDKFIETLSFGLRLLLLIIVPAAVGIIVLAEPINRLLFEYGRFDPAAISAVAQASIFYTLGLVAFAGVKVVAPTFYALNDAKTPVMAAVAAVLVNISLNLLLMNPMGYRGLALATSLAAVVNLSFLIVRLRKRVGRLDGKRILNSFWRVCLAGLGMGFLIWQGSRGWMPAGGAGMVRWELALKVFGLIIFGIFAYVAFAWFFKVPEQKRVWKLVKTKVGLAGSTEPWIE
ncbi:murein biosynthesis integral membrane protein MurJ [bacterium]|nr:murein biosynthesis integral membrane protein MurJ [bacterium]